MRTRKIYFLKPRDSLGPIKIGSTEMFDTRFRNLMSWSPLPLQVIVTVPGSFKLEHRLHDCFAHARLHHEWFSPVPALLTGIGKLLEGHPLEEAFDLSAVTGNFRIRRKAA